MWLCGFLPVGRRPCRVFLLSLIHIFGGLTREATDEIYDLIVENPVYYQHYFLSGMLFMDMRQQAEEALGRDFDEVEYHEVVLSCGPAPLSYVQEKVDGYIQNAEKAA